MTLAAQLRRELSRMEEACRQTQRQLDLIDRQITRRMTALIPGLLPRRCVYRPGGHHFKRLYWHNHSWPPNIRAQTCIFIHGG